MIVFCQVFITDSYKSLYCHCNSFSVKIASLCDIGVKLVFSTATGLLSRVIVLASRKIKPEMRACQDERLRAMPRYYLFLLQSFLCR